MTKQQRFVLACLADDRYHSATEIGKAGTDHFNPGKRYRTGAANWACPRLKALESKQLVFQSLTKEYKRTEKGSLIALEVTQ